MGSSTGVVQAMHSSLVLELGENVWVCYMIVFYNM